MGKGRKLPGADVARQNKDAFAAPLPFQKIFMAVKNDNVLRYFLSCISGIRANSAAIQPRLRTISRSHRRVARRSNPETRAAD